MNAWCQTPTTINFPMIAVSKIQSKIGCNVKSSSNINLAQCGLNYGTMHQPLKTILFKCFDLLPSKYAQSRNGWSAQSVVLWLSFIGFASFLCTVIFLAGTQPGIFNFVNSVPLGDKIGHFVLMGIFSMLANQLFGNKAIKVGVAPILAGSMLIFIPIFFEEISQLWIVTRTFSFFDLVADMLGIIAGGLVSRKIGSRIY